MFITTPAKLNLFLFITGKREDGYHLLFTLFQKISLFDTLEIVKSASQGIHLTCPPWLDSGKDNLVYQAAETFFEASGITPSVQITLEKDIPAGGGLGGGSSDAAATLKGLNSMFNSPLSKATLHRLASALGADCPFFLLDEPAAIGTGTGEILEPVTTEKRWFVLVMPDFGVNTAWAYKNFKLTTRHQDTIFDARAPLDALLWNNDLEQPVMEKYPEIGKIKELLRDAGAEAAMMTGSGSTVFGVFSSEKAARAAMDNVKDRLPNASLRIAETLG